MRSLAVLSLHSSPLAQPGTGDSGGMNVYVRQLVSALAQAGVDCRVYVRRWRDDLPGPAKRTYRLTDAGRRLLDDWVTALRGTRARIDSFLSHFDREEGR